MKNVVKTYEKHFLACHFESFKFIRSSTYNLKNIVELEKKFLYFSIFF